VESIRGHGLDQRSIPGFKAAPPREWGEDEEGNIWLSSDSPPLPSFSARLVIARPGVVTLSGREVVESVLLLAVVIVSALPLKRFRTRMFGFLSPLDDLPAVDEERTFSSRECTDLWYRSTDDEKRVLFLVARGALIPGDLSASAAALLRRGLLVDYPVPRVAPGLQEYVSDLPAAPTPGGPSPMPPSRIARQVFEIILLAAGVFLFVTQRDASLAIVSGLGTLIPGLVKVLDALRSAQI
jgi:hypothetical protein